jgi:hypothetical protein
MSAQSDFFEETKVIKRNGVTMLLQYLKDDTDFFTAPASTKFHGAHEAGLLLHSLTVYDIMKGLDELLDLNLSKESMAICGLFHDVCKTNFYQLDEEEPSQAQLKYIQDLCEQANIKMPAKIDRTKNYMSIIINALKSGAKELPPFRQNYKIVDKLPMGHGEKSVYIICKFMPLTDEEALAIRWHLGGFDPGVNFNYPSGLPQKQAFRENKLAALLVAADISASYLIDTW